jgi:hypothetical protein
MGMGVAFATTSCGVANGHITPLTKVTWWFIPGIVSKLVHGYRWIKPTKWDELPSIIVSPFF